MSEPLKIGDILHYPYLWEWQDRRGETEGRKERPCCLALVAPQSSGHTRVYFLPITTTPPREHDVALPVPAIEARRANLERDKKQWVILTEWNADILEESYYLDRGGDVIGTFSKQFLKQCLAILQERLTAGKLATIRRND